MKHLFLLTEKLASEYFYVKKKDSTYLNDGEIYQKMSYPIYQNQLPLI